MNLTDGARFPEALIKHAKTRVYQKIKLYVRHRATHTGNCNKQWLEHIDCPDITWYTWWKFSFQGKFSQYTTKTCWTITQVYQEKFKASGDRVVPYIFWWVIKRTLWSPSWTYKKIWYKNHYLMVLSCMFYRNIRVLVCYLLT